MLENLSQEVLFTILLFLLFLSGFFSSSETAMLSLNKYRLQHLASSGNRSAKIAEGLLAEPDKLLGFILLGNNFVNILAASLTTTIAYSHFGEAGIAIASAILTLVILIFAEVVPKTFASMYPERVAFVVCWFLKPLIAICYPIVLIVNKISLGILALFRINYKKATAESLSHDELKTMVKKNSKKLAKHQQAILSSLLDFRRIAVKEIMVPRLEIEAINLEDDIEDIKLQFINTPYKLLPVYEDTIDNIKGIVTVKSLITLMLNSQESEPINHDKIKDLLQPGYFIPEYTSLENQFKNFHLKKDHFALVVDEHGDIQGLTTLGDIVKEIFVDVRDDKKIGNNAIIDDVDEGIKVRTNGDGKIELDASIAIRELNKMLKLNLPTDGQTTLNGLLLEREKMIPPPESKINLEGHEVVVLEVSQTAIEKVLLTINNIKN